MYLYNNAERYSKNNNLAFSKSPCSRGESLGTAYMCIIKVYNNFLFP